MPDPAVIANIFQYVGTDKQFQLTVYQADGVTLQDITGWTVSFIIHAYGDPNIVYVTKTVGSGVVLTTPTRGVLTATISATDVTSILPGLYQWRAERTNSANDIVVGTGTYSLLGK